MTKTMTKQTNNLLTHDDEKQLVTQAQAGNRKAMRLLVEHNQGLVHNIVHRFPLKNAQCGYEDLYQQGMLGFIHAVELFEIDRGYRLSTYAYRWIHAYVRRYYQNQGRVIRIPAHLADKKFQLDREVNALTQSLGRVPSQEEVEELVPGYGNLVGVFAPPVSLNKELESGEEIMDVQRDVGEDDTVLHVNSLLDLLKDNVSSRDYNIFIMRYGVDSCYEHTLNEVADMFGLTRARVHQITNHCLSVIKMLAD
jgi:RNA polymerase sigma factor (sigma-70 family)